MPQAKLSIRLPEATWIYEVSTKYPETQFNVLAAMESGDKGIGLLEISGVDIDSVVVDISQHDEILDLEVLNSQEESCLLEFETKNPLVLMAAQESGAPIETPFEINSGKVIWELTASHERLSELGEQLRKFGLDFDVEYVREIDTEQILTDRQRQIVIKAVENGYYDTPRRTSLTELADTVGVSKSTCSDILHRAEEKMVKNFMENLSKESDFSSQKAER